MSKLSSNLELMNELCVTSVKVGLLNLIKILRLVFLKVFGTVSQTPVQKISTIWDVLTLQQYVKTKLLLAKAR